MSISLRESVTSHNLMRAFAGESQARNRYTFAASLCQKQKLPVLEAVFQFTADQEKAHAEIFFQHMKALSGGAVSIEGDYPVEVSNDILSLLRSAQQNELGEYEDIYPTFADLAAKEGFPQIAASFRQISHIEQSHAKRFEALADLLEAGKLFVSDSACGWMCLNCGHVFEGTQAPAACPVCDHPQGFFIRLEMAPYTCKGMRLLK